MYSKCTLASASLVNYLPAATSPEIASVSLFQFYLLLLLLLLLF